jgi:hypothetical protein
MGALYDPALAQFPRPFNEFPQILEHRYSLDGLNFASAAPGLRASRPAVRERLSSIVQRAQPSDFLEGRAGPEPATNGLTRKILSSSHPGFNPHSFEQVPHRRQGLDRPTLKPTANGYHVADRKEGN